MDQLTDRILYMAIQVDRSLLADQFLKLYATTILIRQKNSIRSDIVRNTEYLCALCICIFYCDRQVGMYEACMILAIYYFVSQH